MSATQDEWLNALETLIERETIRLPDGTDCALAGILRALEALGVVTRTGEEGEFRLANAFAGRHLCQIMRLYMLHSQRLFGHLDSQSPDQSWVRIVSVLEDRRRQWDEHNEPLRRVVVGAAAIVGEGKTGRCILAEKCPGVAGPYYKLPGGQRVVGELEVEATRRELAEEIQRDAHAAFTLAPQPLLERPLRYVDVSRSCGVLTEYELSVFTVASFGASRLTYAGSKIATLEWLTVSSVSAALSRGHGAVSAPAFCDAVLGHARSTDVAYALAASDEERVAQLD